MTTGWFCRSAAELLLWKRKKKTQQLDFFVSVLWCLNGAFAGAGSSWSLAAGLLPLLSPSQLWGWLDPFTGWHNSLNLQKAIPAKRRGGRNKLKKKKISFWHFRKLNCFSGGQWCRNKRGQGLWPKGVGWGSGASPFLAAGKDPVGSAAPGSMARASSRMTRSPDGRQASWQCSCNRPSTLAGEPSGCPRLDNHPCLLLGAQQWGGMSPLWQRKDLKSSVLPPWRG